VILSLLSNLCLGGALVLLLSHPAASVVLGLFCLALRGIKWGLGAVVLPPRKGA
jgi:hypothetical protein